ncbi:DinB family protein [Lacrimispora amygdalina]|uniref:DinB family protein n=1 Tax=Lacrimispora amygdalina TaxID=253257 RepID=A0A3E2NAY9_9FIRM|nr:DinB family protein [Clostridium indicum]RFZ78185.1 DinB family protein [Clostridium indicum]
MKYFGEGLSEEHKALNQIIRKKQRTEEAIKIFLDIHKQLHRSNIKDREENETDRLFGDLKPWEYAVMPGREDETIAWVVWHIARIEDLTMGILAARGDQLFNEDWCRKINSPIKDTGNALSDEEIMAFSKQVNCQELLDYRSAVGERTREIVSRFTFEDMKREVNQADLMKIQREGGVTLQKDSEWLLEFWGTKDVAGLLLMPPTRHVMLHLNDCCKWKEKIRTRTKLFLV